MCMQGVRRFSCQFLSCAQTKQYENIVYDQYILIYIDASKQNTKNNAEIERIELSVPKKYEY